MFAATTAAAFTVQGEAVKTEGDTEEEEEEDVEQAADEDDSEEDESEGTGDYRSSINPPLTPSSTV